MAGLTIETKLRPCYILGANDSKTKALFHCWSFHSDIYSPSPLVGGHGGGVVARTAAIVELEDGSVTLIHPQSIKFVSGICEEYAWEK
jgi:hypothetical protein